MVSFFKKIEVLVMSALGLKARVDLVDDKFVLLSLVTLLFPTVVAVVVDSVATHLCNSFQREILFTPSKSGSKNEKD